MLTLLDDHHVFVDSGRSRDPINCETVEHVSKSDDAVHGTGVRRRIKKVK